MARPTNVTAAMYAAYKALERELDKDGELPPGFSLNVSGQTVTVTLPKDTVVERDIGTNGNGTIFKTATQNLYGWHVFTLFAERMKKFRQWDVIAKALLEVLEHCLDQNGKKQVCTRLEEIDNDFAQKVANLKEEMKPPMRCEQTPRVCKATPRPATIEVKTK